MVMTYQIVDQLNILYHQMNLMFPGHFFEAILSNAPRMYISSNCADRHETRLFKHVNTTAIQLLDNTNEVRRLKRHKPADLSVRRGGCTVGGLLSIWIADRHAISFVNRTDRCRRAVFKNLKTLPSDFIKNKPSYPSCGRSTVFLEGTQSRMNDDELETKTQRNS